MSNLRQIGSKSKFAPAANSGFVLCQLPRMMATPLFKVLYSGEYFWPLASLVRGEAFGKRKLYEKIGFKEEGRKSSNSILLLFNFTLRCLQLFSEENSKY